MDAFLKRACFPLSFRDKVPSTSSPKIRSSPDLSFWTSFIELTDKIWLSWYREMKYEYVFETSQLILAHQQYFTLHLLLSFSPSKPNYSFNLNILQMPCITKKVSFWFRNYPAIKLARKSAMNVAVFPVEKGGTWSLLFAYQSLCDEMLSSCSSMVAHVFAASKGLQQKAIGQNRRNLCYDHC